MTDLVENRLLGKTFKQEGRVMQRDKVYLVNLGVDMGYHVQRVFISEALANEYAEKLKQLELSYNKHFRVHSVWVEEVLIFTSMEGCWDEK